MQAGDGRPSYDELAALVVSQAAVITQLRAEVAGLCADVAELKRQLGQNSSTHRGHRRRILRSSNRLRSRCAVRVGANRAVSQGIRGRRWRWSTPRTCACGTSPARAAGAGESGERSGGGRGAAAGVRLAADGRAGDRASADRAPAQYGPRITTIILYLYVGQFLSKKRTARALAELFGTSVCEGTVARMTTRGRRPGRVPQPGHRPVVRG